MSEGEEGFSVVGGKTKRIGRKQFGLKVLDDCQCLQLCLLVFSPLAILAIMSHKVFMIL